MFLFGAESRVRASIDQSPYPHVVYGHGIAETLPFEKIYLCSSKDVERVMRRRIATVFMVISMTFNNINHKNISNNNIIC